MIKLIANKILMAFFMLFVAIGLANADTGDVFRITGSGTVATLDTKLCLSVNGTKPWNCENHTVTRQILSISTVTPHHTYPAAGIKVLTSGYTLSGCTFLSNGYCQFSVSDINAANVNATFLAAPTLSSITPNTGTAAGGTGFSVTGTNLTGATGITFDGASATGVYVVDSTTVTGVTPAHAADAVDVVITTPQGTAMLANGYTYQETEVGQSAYGGVIACLYNENNLIAATADAPNTLVWGEGRITDATSITDGATNTNAIVAAEGSGTYAAKYCDDYEIDSQNNSPCQTGNTCYNDWFLPAGHNTGNTGQLHCLSVNRAAIPKVQSGVYWSSTEANANFAWAENITKGTQLSGRKSNNNGVRCVRSFTP